MSWTEERVELLRKLWGEGKTAAEIARELGGVTRNAVIGKAHRMKLSNRVSPIQQNKKTARKSSNDDKPARPAARRSKTPEEAFQPASGDGIKMAELRERSCRWPIGDPKSEDFRFCGCKSAHGLPYCETHARIAYQPAGRGRTMKPEEVERIEARAAEKEAANG